MTRKKKILKDLAEYFITKGKVLSKREYLKEKDTPHRSTIVLRQLSSWARIEGLIEYNFPELYSQIGDSQVELEEEVDETTEEDEKNEE